MARRCDLTGLTVQSGNNVSHSHKKTRRRFLPNIQNVSLYSSAISGIVKLKIATSTLRSIDHNGGLDQFLLSTSNSVLTEKAKKIKKLVVKRLADDNSGSGTQAKKAASPVSKS